MFVTVLGVVSVLPTTPGVIMELRITGRIARSVSRLCRRSVNLHQLVPQTANHLRIAVGDIVELTGIGAHVVQT